MQYLKYTLLIFVFALSACGGSSGGGSSPAPTPGGQTPDSQTPDGQTPDGQTPGGQTPTPVGPQAKVSAFYPNDFLAAALQKEATEEEIVFTGSNLKDAKIELDGSQLVVVSQNDTTIKAKVPPKAMGEYALKLNGKALAINNIAQKLNFVGIESIQLSERHGCVLLTNGTAQCVGESNDNKLSRKYDETNYAKLAPLMANKGRSNSKLASVKSVAGIKKLVLSGRTTLAVVGDSPQKILQFGNSAEKLGINDGLRLVDIAAGDSGERNYICMVVQQINGTRQEVSCRSDLGGANSGGAILGMGTTAAVTFGKVKGLDGTDDIVKQIAVGYSHACVLLENGAVKCWGSNYKNRIDESSTNTLYKQATNVNIGGKATQIAVGSRNTCALMEDKTVTCWGDNDYGQLGQGDVKTYTGKVTVKNLSNIVQIATATRNSCAINEAGQLYCWGYGVTRGDGNMSAHLKQPGDPILSNVKQVSLVMDTACAVLNDGSARCWGENGYHLLMRGSSKTSDKQATADSKQSIVNSLSATVSATYRPLRDDIKLAAFGEEHAVVLSNAGKLQAIGANSNGQLGNGTSFHSYKEYVDVDTSELGEFKVAKLYADKYHRSCAISDQGAAACWGSNSRGELGTLKTSSNNIQKPALVQLEADEKAADISFGVYHMCVLLENGKAKCAGDNRLGQLGHGKKKADGNYDKSTQTSLQPVAGLSNITQLAAHYGETCALNKAGTAYCWGYGLSNRLGHGLKDADGNPDTKDKFIPTTVSMSIKVASLGKGEYPHNNMGLLGADGKVYNWGGAQATPKALDHTENIAKFYADYCYQLKSGETVCQNRYGQFYNDDRRNIGFKEPNKNIDVVHGSIDEISEKHIKQGSMIYSLIR